MIGAVYGGERDHQRVVLRMLAKLPKPKPSAAKRTIGAPLATVQKSSEAMLSRQATRRLRIAGDMLTQVVAPLGRVCSEARTRFAAAVKKQKTLGLKIVRLSSEVVTKRRECLSLLRACKEARQRERDRRAVARSRSPRDDKGLSSIFSAFSDGVSNMLNGTLGDLARQAEGAAIRYQQAITRANQAQEHFIRVNLPRLIKLYGQLASSVTKMTKKALTEGIKFQTRDVSVEGLLKQFSEKVTQVDSDRDLAKMTAAQVLTFYSDLCSTFRSKRWKYDLPLKPTEIKSANLLIREDPAIDQDFVVVRRRPKKSRVKTKGPKGPKGPRGARAAAAKNINEKKSKAQDPSARTTETTVDGAKPRAMDCKQEIPQSQSVSVSKDAGQDSAIVDAAEAQVGVEVCGAPEPKPNSERQAALLSTLLGSEGLGPDVDEDDEDDDDAELRKAMADVIAEEGSADDTQDVEISVSQRQGPDAVNPEAD